MNKKAILKRLEHIACDLNEGAFNGGSKPLGELQTMMKNHSVELRRISVVLDFFWHERKPRTTKSKGTEKST